jgi:hypothetical protein
MGRLSRPKQIIRKGPELKCPLSVMKRTGIVTNTILWPGIEVPVVINGSESMWFQLVMSCLKFCTAVCLKGLSKVAKSISQGSQF